ncbi:MAG: T9SS type A sorting domain-containing protein [Bacteroidetes bacterium]|nr:T9SS type A sorting domain-containing protein [Bacteroidota bacterium]
MKKFTLSYILFLTFLASIKSQPCIPNTNSLDFNGTSSAVRINSTMGLEMINQLTIEAWINPGSFAASSTGNSIFCKHHWGSSTFGYVLRCGGTGVLSFNLAGAVSGSPVGWKEVTSPDGSLVLNTWQHVAGTFDGSNLKCYVNGNLVGTFAFTGTIYPSTGFKARIGALCDTTWSMTRYFDGLIDEVRVWNRALTASEIQAGMNDHIDPASQTGLVGYYRFNEGSGNVVSDLGVNNYYGTILGAQWSTQVPFNNNSLPTPVITYVAPNLHSSYSTGNQWYFGTTLIPGATQQDYLPTQYGNYKVVVTDSTGCTAISLPFNYNTTNIPENNGGMITLSPNPAHHSLSVKCQNNTTPLLWHLFDITGQGLTGGIIGETESVIDLSAFKPGLYIIRLGAGEGEMIRKIMIY